MEFWNAAISLYGYIMPTSQSDLDCSFEDHKDNRKVNIELVDDTEVENVPLEF